MTALDNERMKVWLTESREEGEDGLVFNLSALDEMPDLVGDETCRMDTFMTRDKCTALLAQNLKLAKKVLFWGRCYSAAANACRNAKSEMASWPQLKGYSIIGWILPRNCALNYRQGFLDSDVGRRARAENAFWSSCSEALAVMTEGIAYVMLPDARHVLQEDGSLSWVNAGARAGSTVELHEYPRLCRNRKVKELYHISVENPKFSENLTMKMLHDRNARACPDPAPIPKNLEAPKKDSPLDN